VSDGKEAASDHVAIDMIPGRSKAPSAVSSSNQRMLTFTLSFFGHQTVDAGMPGGRLHVAVSVLTTYKNG